MAETTLDRNIRVATRVCEGWHRFGLDDFRECFADDVEYQNMPISEVQKGPDAVYAALREVPLTFQVELKIRNVIADENAVMAERVELFAARDGSREPFELPVLGIFEFRDGKICAWRDYFDMKQFTGK